MKDVSGVRDGDVPVQEARYRYEARWLRPNAAGHYQPGKGWRIHSILDHIGNPPQVALYALLERAE